MSNHRIKWDGRDRIETVTTIENGVTVARINGQIVSKIDFRPPVPTPNPFRGTGKKHRIRKQEIADHLGIPVDQLEIVE